MLKKIISSALVGAVVLGFSGCMVDESEEVSGGSSAQTLLITMDEYADNINIVWNRSGDMKYGSYTQLEISNENDSQKIATTNSDAQIIIKCEKRESRSERVKYLCSPNNVSTSYYMSLEDNMKNYVIERAGVNKNRSTKTFAKLSLNSDASYDVSY